MAARAANAPTIPVHRGARRRVLLPVASTTIGFGDVAADSDRLEIDERLVAVIALIANHLDDAIAVGPHRLDLLGGVNQRLDAGRRVWTRQPPTASVKCSGLLQVPGIERMVIARRWRMEAKGSHRVRWFRVPVDDWSGCTSLAGGL